MSDSEPQIYTYWFGTEESLDNDEIRRLADMTSEVVEHEVLIVESSYKPLDYQERKQYIGELVDALDAENNYEGYTMGKLEDVSGGPSPIFRVLFWVSALLLMLVTFALALGLWPS